jgi:hypothetical protein
MNKLQPDEELLVGGSIVENGEVRKDAIGERIDWLLSHSLEKISDSAKRGRGKPFLETRMMGDTGSVLTLAVNCMAAGPLS